MHTPLSLRPIFLFSLRSAPRGIGNIYVIIPKKKKQDNLTNVVSHSMGLSENQSLSYAFIPRLEDLLNVNIYVLSSALGNAFSYISQNHDQERKKNILVSRREGIGGTLSRHRENWWIFCTFKFLLLVS